MTNATTIAERNKQIGELFTRYLHEARRQYEAGQGTREDLRRVWVQMHYEILSLKSKEYGEMFLELRSETQDKLTREPERFPFDEFFRVVTLFP
jgi:hypothetical protein